MENKHIEYPSMPFDIDDVVYYTDGKLLLKTGKELNGFIVE